MTGWPQTSVTPEQALKVCFSNLTGDTGVRIPPQNLEDAFDAYDTLAAADVKIVDRRCRARVITVLGQYSDDRPSRRR